MDKAAARARLAAWLPLLALGAAFFVLNLLFLTRYPFIHSDESWLAGLTRNMMERRTLGVTETFFDLKPRHPHAIKSLFHLLQMGFISLAGYTPLAVRLLSLCGGAAALLLFGRCAKRLAGPGAALAAAGVLACDSAFVTASHLARQEVLVLCALLGCLVLLLRGPVTRRGAAMLALITGLTVGLHPNAFVVAAACGCALLARWLLFGEGGAVPLLLYVGVTGAVAALFVAASLRMDPQFVAHYAAYGQSEFGLTLSLPDRIQELPAFFGKLWRRESGTYLVPEARPQLALLGLLAPLALCYALVMRREDPAGSRGGITVLAALLGVLGGTVLIGRYNQNTLVFFTALGWLLLPLCRRLLGRLPGRLLLAAAGALALAGTLISVMPWLGARYEDYLGQLEALVPKDAKVIGNLNSDFYFDNGCLLDYRNLPYLADNGLDFAGYVAQNGVEYLILTDELTWIYENRPRYNAIYGDPTFMEQVDAFAAARCTPAGGFQNPVYGPRVRALVGSGECAGVRVLRVEG